MLQHFASTFDKLKGLTVTEVEREHDSSIILRFGTMPNEIGLDIPTPSVAIQVSGDCCSSSIFYAFDVCELPAVIEGAQQYVMDEKAHDEQTALALCDEDFKRYTDCLSIWDVVLQTNKGEIRLRHINDSNGYYDGYISLS